MPRREGRSPAEVALGTKRKTDSQVHGPQILTYATGNRR
jgi:hypothetical protein